MRQWLDLSLKFYFVSFFSRIKSVSEDGNPVLHLTETLFFLFFFAIPGNVRRTVETRATILISKMVQLRWTIIFPNWEIDSRLLRNNTALLIFLFFFHFLISQVNKFNDFWKKRNISTFLITRLMIVIMKIYIKYD